MIVLSQWDQRVPILYGDHFPVPCAQIMLYLSVCSVASLRNANPFNVTGEVAVLYLRLQSSAMSCTV